MSRSSKLVDLTRTHEDYALDLIRIFLGVALFIRGVLFIADSSRIVDLVQLGDGEFLMPSVLMYVAILAHLLGGLMLAVGLLTQIAALFQIPVLLGAVYISTIRGGLVGPDQSLELSALVLFLLVILFVFGAGRVSVDYMLFGPGSMSEDEHLERRRVAAAALKARIHELDEKRRTEEEVIRMAEETGSLPEPLPRSDVAGTVTKVAKTVLAVAGAGVILALGIEALPFRVTATQIAITAGMLFLIVGFFFMFFSWALNDNETEV